MGNRKSTDKSPNRLQKLEEKMKISKFFFALTAVAAQNDSRDERLKREAKEFNSEKEAKEFLKWRERKFQYEREEERIDNEYEKIEEIVSLNAITEWSKMIAEITNDANVTKTNMKDMKMIENTSASNSETRNTETFKNKIEKKHFY